MQGQIAEVLPAVCPHPSKCRASSRNLLEEKLSLLEEKSKSPLLAMGGLRAMVTNDWCITHAYQ